MLQTFQQIQIIEQKLTQQIENKIIQDYRISLKTDMFLEIFILVDNNQNIDVDIFKNILFNENNKKLDLYELDIVIVKEREKNYDPMYGYIFSDKYLGENAKIDLGLTWRFDSLLNINTEKEENQPKNPCNVVTFYSYKGGMGRTTTLCAYATHLALKGKKVVILDCDFEAPGFLSFFDNEGKQGSKGGLVEYMMDKDFLGKENLNLKENYLIEVEKTHYQSENGKIYVLPAGNLSYEEVAYTPNEQQQKEHLDRHLYHYIHGLARLNVANTVDMVAKFRNLFVDLKNDLGLSEDDYILIDSRTGFNEILGITAFNLANVIVGFFGSSEQTRAGLYFLLDKYQDIRPQPKLMLVNSIVPNDENIAKDFLDSFKTLTQEYKDKKESEWDILGSVPIVSLRENKVLKQAGVKFFDKEGKEIKAQENELLKLVKTGEFSDYYGKEQNFEDLGNIFNRINNFFVKEAEVLDIDKLSVKELRDVVLSDLQNTLNGLPLFAEDANPDIDIKTFFYREHMKELFKKEKFIIQGFKGSGKTYLYKALQNKEITRIILEKANVSASEQYHFINILPLKGATDKYKDFPYKNKSEITSITKVGSFWSIYMWVSMLLDDSMQEYFNEYRQTNHNEQLTQDIEHLKNASETERKIIFEKYLKNDTNLILVEKDLQKINQFLKSKKIKIFVLFDQLDKIADLKDWAYIITPLIEFWRDNYNQDDFSNIYPKIFIRTDIMPRILRTNNSLSLKETSTIKIEWSPLEIYAYFFKLIFCEKKSEKAFFEIMKKYQQYNIDDVTLLEKKIDVNNQPELNNGNINKLLITFFGNMILSPKGLPLGQPYDFFYNNFCNANGTISLRPFLNTMRGSVNNGIKNILPNYQPTEDRPHEINPIFPEFVDNPPFEPILHYCYTTNSEVRIEATKNHFDDLTSEPGNETIKNIKEYIKDVLKKGDVLKMSTLTYQQMDELMNKIINEPKFDMKNKESLENLKDLLIINGIVEKDERYRLYRFAQMYKYWLGLSSPDSKRNTFTNHKTHIDQGNNTEQKNGKIKNLTKSKSGDNIGFITFEGKDIFFHNKYLVQGLNFHDLKIGDDVSFIIGRNKEGLIATFVRKIS